MSEEQNATVGDQRVVEATLGEMTELESLCPRCERNGTTRIMVTEIPHFKQIIVSSFECPHCNERNNEVQFGGAFGDYHTVTELKVENEKDLNRQVVKSEFATVTVPELQLEIPPQTQKGVLNTVEGLLRRTMEGLQVQQPVRRIMEPTVAAQIDDFCAKVETYCEGEKPFTLVVDDPAGNSYVEPLYDYYHPTIDPKLTRYENPRTEIDRQLLGLPIDYNTRRTKDEEQAVEDGALPDVVVMDTACSACGKMGETKFHQCDIPYFKETLIMAFKCDYCGFKSNEVKSGGAVPDKGKKITLTVSSVKDLQRDVLKGATASLEIPEVELELTPGTMGGFFTTVEGTLQQIIERLGGTGFLGFEEGDAAQHDNTKGGDEGPHTMKGFLKKLEELKTGGKPFTMILDDPLGNVYVQSLAGAQDNDDDPAIKVEEYERSNEQNEELGLNDLDC